MGLERASPQRQNRRALISLDAVVLRILSARSRALSRLASHIKYAKHDRTSLYSAVHGNWFGGIVTFAMHLQTVCLSANLHWRARSCFDVVRNALAERLKRPP